MKGYEILEVLITSSVLILGITALRVLAGDRLSGRVRYALWLAVALRLLLPFLFLAAPSLEEGLQNGYGIMKALGIEWGEEAEPAVSGIMPSGASSAAGGGGQNAESAGAGSQIWTEEPAGAADRTAGLRQTGTEAPRTVVEETGEGPVRASSVNWPAAAAGVWAGGAVLLMLWELFVNLSFYRKLKRSRKPFLQEQVPLRVYVTPAVRMPCQYGGCIYLPKSLSAEADAAELRHVLIHEYCHYRHKDFLWSLLRCVLLALYWADPFVWLAAVLSKKDCELACDEAALKRLKRSERLGYGKTLVRLASGKEEKGGMFRAAMSLAGSWGTVRERIWRVALRKKRFSGVVTVCTAVLGIVLLAGCSFTGKGGKKFSLKLAETEGEELWFNDKIGAKNYGEMALLASDGNYYGLGRLEPLGEMEEAEDLFAAMSGEIVPADYDGDGTEELAVTVRRRAEAGKADCWDQEWLFILEPEGDGWRAYEYRQEAYAEDWEKFAGAMGVNDFPEVETSLRTHPVTDFAAEDGRLIFWLQLKDMHAGWVKAEINYRGDGKFLLDGKASVSSVDVWRELARLEAQYKDRSGDSPDGGMEADIPEIGEQLPQPAPIPEPEVIPAGEEPWWFGKDERSFSTMLAETEGEELWYNDEAGAENYGELAVLAGDGNYYVLGSAEEPEEMDIRDLSVSVSGEMRLADYDGDGIEELAVTVKRRAEKGRKLYSDVTRLFILERLGDGWHPYEYRAEAYAADWKTLLPPKLREKEGVRYDKLVEVYLREDVIDFHSYSASWDGEYGYVAPDGGIMSRLEVRAEYQDAGGFSLSGPYAPEGQEEYLDNYRKMMER